MPVSSLVRCTYQGCGRLLVESAFRRHFDVYHLSVTETFEDANFQYMELVPVAHSAIATVAENDDLADDMHQIEALSTSLQASDALMRRTAQIAELDAEDLDAPPVPFTTGRVDRRAIMQVCADSYASDSGSNEEGKETAKRVSFLDVALGKNANDPSGPSSALPTAEEGEMSSSSTFATRSSQVVIAPDPSQLLASAASVPSTDGALLIAPAAAQTELPAGKRGARASRAKGRAKRQVTTSKRAKPVVRKTKASKPSSSKAVHEGGALSAGSAVAEEVSPAPVTTRVTRSQAVKKAAMGNEAKDERPLRESRASKKQKPNKPLPTTEPTQTQASEGTQSDMSTSTPQEAAAHSYLLTISKPSREAANEEIYAKYQSLPSGKYNLAASSLTIDEKGASTLRAVRANGEVEVHQAIEK